MHPAPYHRKRVAMAANVNGSDLPLLQPSYACCHGERWDSGDRFCEAQSVCNLVEIALQLLALRLWLGNNQQHHPAAALVALIAQVWGCFRCGCWRSGAAQEASSAHGGN